MSERKTISRAADLAEGGGRPLKRGATEIVNASADDDDIFKEAVSEPKRRKEDGKKEDEEEDKAKSKHTLDSDEEDEEKYDRLDMKKVDGQEDETIEYDGDTKITAFNMKEEEDDGHFDASGNFIFNKKDNDANDAWLEGIDWSRVKKNAGKDWQGEGDEEDEGAPPPVLTDVRRREIMGRLLELLKPEQTVTKALTTLKKVKALTPAEERKARWAAKKEGREYVADDNGKKTAELSALADELLTAGHMDAYEWPREKVSFLLGRLQKTAVDEVDMFGDPIVPAAGAAASSSAAAAAAAMDDDEVMWEYKAEPDDDDVKGPFNSMQMAEKQGNDELGAKCVARKVGSGSSFNPAARIDFDLYC
ncbi:teg-1 [Pristionchus pacificus]|uniref:Teg-1 n=1 Tax=Pristionchus pacificus TaxID=54126 RepID=A0A2A6B592_PRIPA|nr:teg-1 [Pristionchus pacificus]|eukprot:PDM61046.1 teg-1 [Pristionchus pacificus]